MWSTEICIPSPKRAYEKELSGGPRPAIAAHYLQTIFVLRVGAQGDWVLVLSFSWNF